MQQHDPNIICLDEDWKGEPICLFIDGQEGFKADYFPSSDLPTHLKIKLGNEVRDIPCAYAWKDCLIPGQYRKHATDQELNLSTEDLAGMVATVKEYLKNGNAIPVPLKDHDEERNVGYVLDARMNEGRLELYHQLIGQDAALAALRNKVSVQIHGTHIDPKNNTYKRCIVHSSLTPSPVVTGQRDWAPIAASRGEQSVASTYVFAASRSSDMTIAQLRALLGLGDTVSDADVLKAAGEKITGFKGLETANAALTTEKTQLSQAVTAEKAKVTELTTKLEASKTEVVTLSQRVNKHKPSAHELYFAKEAITAKREAAIKSGAIIAAVADKAEVKYLGTIKLDTISLSREVTDADVALADGLARTMDFYDTVAGNKPAPADGVQSGDQQRTAVDEKKGEGDKDKAKDKDKDKDKVTEYKSAKDVTSASLRSRYKGPAGMEVQTAKA